MTLSMIILLLISPDAPLVGQYCRLHEPSQVVTGTGSGILKEVCVGHSCVRLPLPAETLR